MYLKDLTDKKILEWQYTYSNFTLMAIMLMYAGLLWDVMHAEMFAKLFVIICNTTIVFWLITFYLSLFIPKEAKK